MQCKYCKKQKLEAIPESWELAKYCTDELYCKKCKMSYIFMDDIVLKQIDEIMHEDRAYIIQFSDKFEQEIFLESLRAFRDSSKEELVSTMFNFADESSSLLQGVTFAGIDVLRELLGESAELTEIAEEKIKPN